MAVKIPGLLGMFDKIDDIVYEPVRLICDGLRQPLKQMDAANERKQMELAARLQREAEAFSVKVELDKKRGEAEIEANLRQRHVEIDNMIADKEFERNQKTVEAIKQYQEDLSKAAAKLSECIGSMSIELRERAHRMCIDKTNDYIAIQNQATNRMLLIMKQIREDFPEECPERTMLLERVADQERMIVARADELLQVMTKDMERLADSLDRVAEQAAAKVDKYLSPLRARELSGALQSPNAYEMKRLPE